MAKKIETTLILRNSLLKFVEKKEFPSKKAAKDYAIEMYKQRKASFYSIVDKSAYSVYMDYKPKYIWFLINPKYRLKGEQAL